MTLPGSDEPTRPGEHPEEKKMLEAAAAGESGDGWQKPGLEKFQNADQLADAYLALQSKMGERQDAAIEQAPTQPAADPDSQSLEIPKATPQDANAKLQPFVAEFVEKGELSDDSLGKLEGLGYPRDLVAAYVTGQQALAQQAVDQVHQLVGGKDQYGKLMQWAANNLDDGSRDTFDSQVRSHDPAAAMFAVKGLYAQYQAATGATAPLLEGGRTNGVPANAFRSEAEVVAAMQDPRYMNPAKSDPAYVKDVNERLRNSDVFPPKKR